VLPYRPLAGVVPCPGGWLIAGGKLQGITLSPDGVEVVERLVDVLDWRPAFEIIALAAPVGLLSAPQRGGRTCDREARRVLGWPRSGAIQSAPCRAALGAATFAEAVRANGGISSVQWAQLPHIAEIDREVQPHLQRTVFEVHPELSFHQLNGDATLRHGKHTPEGRAERRELLTARLPGVERVLDRRLRRARPEHALDAAAALWTARRIASRSVIRLPRDPEWDDQGLRMELVR
jgi:predicted RNase H-like nuclease